MQLFTDYRARELPANREAEAAAAEAPGSPRPWIRYGRRLALRGRPAEAVAAYDRAALVARQSWSPTVARPRLPSTRAVSTRSRAGIGWNGRSRLGTAILA